MRFYYLLLFTLLELPILTNAASTTQLQEIEVFADLSNNKLLDLSNSVSVVNSDAIRRGNAKHLQQILGIAPNVNFSSGASRGRFFQIRGIGERSQFVDPINPSVGLIIDGIDFTGLGLAANLLDIEQVEILRGPQGTVFGANALAGLISLKSNAPTDYTTHSLETSIAEYGSYSIDMVSSGAINDVLRYRIAGRKNLSDGYIDNNFLNRDDTNDINEEIAKVAITYNTSDNIELNFNLFYLNINNGYDAFSLNNNRQTTSDQPGEDSQETFAGGLRIDIEGMTQFDYQIQFSGLNSDATYAFDEDWSYVGEFDNSLGPYSSADDYSRESDNASIDLRMLSNNKNKKNHFVFGLYFKTEQEKLTRFKFSDLLIDPNFIPSFNSKFKTQRVALYQQMSSSLNDSWTFVSGTRLEYRNAEYEDNANIKENTYKTSIGGRIALEYRTQSKTLFYALVSHGFKAGGVNGQIISSGNANASESTFFFDQETLTNFEIGSKGQLVNDLLSYSANVFVQNRRDAQFKQSEFDPSDFSFDDFLTNANAQSVGAELELVYNPTDSIDLYTSVGILDTEFDNFKSDSHVNARNDFGSTPAEVQLDSVNLNDRDTAHAPNYQFAVGGELRISTRWYINIDIEGKDAFFFSNSHDEKSSKYELYHANLGYRSLDWEIALWARNLTNKNVEERGFYFSNQFGNNPANGYSPEVYTQFGEPRIIGLTGRITFN